MQTSVMSHAQVVKVPALTNVLGQGRALRAHAAHRKLSRGRQYANVQSSTRSVCVVCAAATKDATFYDFAVKVRGSGQRATNLRTLQTTLTLAWSACSFKNMLYSPQHYSSTCAVQDIDGRNTNMSKYKGKVVLAVNVASQCGFTKQYRVSITFSAPRHMFASKITV